MLRAFAIGLAALTAMAASPALADAKLFTDQAPLQIVITAPFSSLIGGAKTSIKPYPATVNVTDGAAAAQTLPIQLSPRGLTRRTAGFCQFPPLLLTFDKTKTKDTVFQGQGKLKLVTYCRTPSDFEQRIMLEYLAYKVFNVITPMSYRVRAADVTYRKDEKDAGTKRFGFLIEDIDDVAHRNKQEKLTAANHAIASSQLDPKATARAALFEYLIANLDWEFLAGPAGVNCCHNSHFIAAKGATPPTAKNVSPLPYDFDYSGFVDAPYALPPEGLKITKVTERVYRGYCISTPELPAVIGEFKAKRSEIMAVVANDPRLNDSFKAKTAKFMDGFFTLLDDPARVDSQIVKHCRN